MSKGYPSEDKQVTEKIFTSAERYYLTKRKTSFSVIAPNQDYLNCNAVDSGKSILFF